MSRIHRSKPEFSTAIFIAVFLGALASGAQMLGIDSDLGRHLTLGNYILDNSIIPTRDLFSHTLSNQSRPPYEWLSQIFFALSHRFLDLDGVILFTSIVIATAFTLTFQFANRRSKSPIIALLITFLATGASSLHWLPRPHIVTFLLLAIWIENLERLRRGEMVKWFIFPLMMLFWANLHGGFIFGILAWVAYFAGWLWETWRKQTDGETGRKFLIVGVTSLTASVVTPDLGGNWEAVLNNRSAFILGRTVETMPPVLTNTAVLPFTLLLFLALVFPVFRWKQVSVSHVFLLGGLGFAALLMSRNIPLFAIASAPILSKWASNTLTRFESWTAFEKRFTNFGGRMNLIPSLAVVLLTIGYFVNHRIKTGESVHQFDPRVFPVQAMDWLEDNPQEGRMFNEFNWGGYILYRAWPRQLVFLDSQSDFYGEDLMRDYEHIMIVQAGWDVLLDKYQVDWAIIPIDSPLAGTLAVNWNTIFRDGITIILHRR